MNLNRRIGPVPFAVVTATSAVVFSALAHRRWASRSAGASAMERDRENGDVTWRDRSGGCQPIESTYPDVPMIVHDVDGTNQGFALAMLREDLIDDADADVPPFDLEYDEAIRSCVEVAINLALTLAEPECQVVCDCGDDDCEANGFNYDILHLVAGQKMTEFAKSFEVAASKHAATCPACAVAGSSSPGSLRARFCRDLADDLLTNPASDQVGMHGVPVPAAMQAITAMVHAITHTEGIPADGLIARLSTGLAGAIGHKEAHESQS